VRLTRDRDNAPVNCRRVGAVDGKLRLAGGFAPIERGEIEEWKADSPLDLQGPGPGEKHRRRMRVDAQRPHAAVGAGRTEEIEDGLLRIGGHARRGVA